MNNYLNKVSTVEQMTVPATIQMSDRTRNSQRREGMLELKPDLEELEAGTQV